jgi:hypothetical protein
MEAGYGGEKPLAKSLLCEENSALGATELKWLSHP